MSHDLCCTRHREVVFRPQLQLTLCSVYLFDVRVCAPPLPLRAVVLDVGTNNKELLEDPDYIGVREERLEGEEYFSLVDEFMSAGA